MKIRPVGAELFHAHGRTDSHDEANGRFSQFCESAQITQFTIFLLPPPEPGQLSRYSSYITASMTTETEFDSQQWQTCLSPSKFPDHFLCQPGQHKQGFLSRRYRGQNVELTNTSPPPQLHVILVEKMANYTTITTLLPTPLTRRRQYLGIHLIHITLSQHTKGLLQLNFT